jgi:hypothetical protein
MIAQTDAEVVHARLVDALGNTCLNLAKRLARERVAGGIGNTEEDAGPANVVCRGREPKGAARKVA